MDSVGRIHVYVLHTVYSPTWKIRICVAYVYSIYVYSIFVYSIFAYKANSVVIKCIKLNVYRVAYTSMQHCMQHCMQHGMHLI